MKCYNHRRLYRWIHQHPHRRIKVRRHFTESSKIITRNATITDGVTDVILSVDISQRVRKQLREMPQSPMPLPTDSPTPTPTDLSSSASHREFENNYRKCHYQWRLYRRLHRHIRRWIYYRRYLTESSKTITQNATITDGIKFVGNLSGPKLTIEILTECANSKEFALNEPLTASDYRRSAENIEGN